ncbi:amino acid ABC transporter permease [Streptomyces sp. NPDC052043]|uniref:amino acid ABC transporter permease n=1 Tax=Streptomyces sp. NPDC052043 TaxID=3365684 RepID=UPI0037CDEA36
MDTDTTGLFDAPGPRARRRILIVTAAAFVLLAGIVALLLTRLAGRGQLEPERWAILFDPSTGVPSTLLNALWSTLQAAALGMVLSLAVGALLAVARLSRNRLVRWPATVLVQFFRGVPLLLLILFAYLALPTLGVDIGVLPTLLLGLVAYNSTVLCEVLRAGVLSVGRGQREAGLSLGLTEGQVLRSILLPQAVRRMLPTIVSQLVILLKDTSLGFVIGYSELLRSGRSLVEFYGNRYALQIYLTVAVLYIAVNFTVSLVADRLARRRSKPAQGQSAAGAAAPRSGPAPASARVDLLVDADGKAKS